MSEPLIKVEGVAKKFCRSLKRSLWYGLKDMATEIGGRSRAQTDLRRDEFWAVRDVSFELRRGECLGLIGRNGAGKTTLLRMLNGLIKPDQGRIEMRGRVGALIALGAGFNPVLTGRENIYVNGAVLGLSKREIDSKLDEIIDFADVRDSIEAPVQSYSSGMQVRLGFAVATALEPDILILDEVLAVGDAAFRAKCYNKIGMLQKNAAVIFVSHSMDQVARISSSVLVMSKGAPMYLGATEQGVAAYESENTEVGPAEESFLVVAAPFIRARVELGCSSIRWNEPVELHLEIESAETVDSTSFYGIVYDASGGAAASFVVDNGHRRPIEAGLNRLKLRIPNVPLASGAYRLGLSMNRPESATQLLWSYKQISLEVHSGPNGFCASRLPASVETVAARRPGAADLTGIAT